MASTLNPYIGFSDNAREAMEFYQSVFGGKLDISTFGSFGGAPEGLSDDNVMHAHLLTDAGFTLMASDTPGNMPFSEGSRISISVSGDDADRLRGYWQRLSEGGEVRMPLERQMWGDEFGMVTDRFGIAWMVNIGSGGEA